MESRTKFTKSVTLVFLGTITWIMSSKSLELATRTLLGEKEENGIRSYKCMGYIFNNSQGGTNEDSYTDNTTLKEE